MKVTYADYLSWPDDERWEMDLKSFENLEV